jgi:hypothetical protein
VVGSGRAVIDAATAGLGDVAGRELYRRNAFRITGLPTDADRRTVRQRQRHVVPALDAGADVDLGHAIPVRPEDVRGAFDRILNNPQRRLVEELFWLWDTPHTTCRCARTLHRDHDAAVRAHSAALDLEVKGEDLTDDELDELDRLWPEAGRLWGQLLRRAVFWDHVRSRIAALDERQLDESVIDALRDKVPLILIKPLIELAAASSDEQGWLADQARSWTVVPSRVIDELLEDAVGYLYEEVGAVLADAATQLDGGHLRGAASVVYRQGMPKLRRLEALVPSDRHRRTAGTRDRAALVLNNCAKILIERDGPGASKDARRWLGTARELTADPQTVEVIDANGAVLNEMVHAIEVIRERVLELVASGRSDHARAMLRDLKRQMRAAPWAERELNSLLAEVKERQPLFGGISIPDIVDLRERSLPSDVTGVTRLERSLSRTMSDDDLDWLSQRVHLRDNDHWNPTVGEHRGFWVRSAFRFWYLVYGPWGALLFAVLMAVVALCMLLL